MDDIRVLLREPSPHGRLIYRRDPQIEQRILFIQSAIRRPVAYMVNLNGAQVILDIDADHILQDVEFLIPRRVWKVAPFDVTPQVT